MPTAKLVRDSLKRDANIIMLLRILTEAEKADALGAAVAFLMHECDTEPHVVGKILNQLVEKPGFRPCTMIDILNKASGRG